MIDLSKINIDHGCNPDPDIISHNFTDLDVGYDFTKSLDYDAMSFFVSSTASVFTITTRSNGEYSNNNVLKTGILKDDTFTIIDFPISVYLMEFHGRYEENIGGSYVEITETLPVIIEHTSDGVLSIYHRGECFLVESVEMLDQKDILNYLKITKQLILQY